MKVWTTKDGKVHSSGKGDLTQQLKELDSIIGWAQNHASNMRRVSAKALNIDPAIVEANEELRRQNRIANRTLETVSADVRRKAMAQKQSSNEGGHQHE